MRSGCLTLAFSGAHKWVEMLRHPYILGDPQNKGGRNQKWLPHLYLLRGPQVGGNATSPLHTRIPQNKGGQNQKWVPHPCSLKGPQLGRTATSSLDTRGSPKRRKTKSEVGTSPLPSRGATSGRKCYVTPTYLEIPKTKGDKIRSGYLIPTFSAAHKWAEMLRHP